MSIKIVPLELENGQKIWIEVTKTEGLQQVGVLERPANHIETVGDTIRQFSRVIIQSIDKIAQDGTIPEKVSLGFAIKFVGEAGIPAIAKGTAEASLVINIDWNIGEGTNQQ
jgi:hypothetical protein